MSVKQKKYRYYALVVPAAKKVHAELMSQYLAVKNELNTTKESPRINALKEKYKVESDYDLLLALKPHPVSIAIAQGAMESAWGTSRFFQEANNVFGLWSASTKHNRIAAGVQRAGNRTIWLRKFDTIEDSVRVYYETIARVKVYKKFREYRYESDDVFFIIKGLDKYSEMGEAYVEQLASVIRYNQLTRFD